MTRDETMDQLQPPGRRHQGRPAAPELAVRRWFNTKAPLTLASLRGKVVVLHAFQMLCPGCVAHALPQAERLQRLFGARGDLTVVGIHSVFEHHAAMTAIALEAFIHEYRLTFPIGVDEPGADGPIPVTMRRYRMQGTPTTVVIDRDGRIAQHAFGQVDDLALGALVGSLLAVNTGGSSDKPKLAGCNDRTCPVPAGARE
jgi:peroxiredoxin